MTTPEEHPPVPAEPRELAGRHAHQAYLTWCAETGKTPPRNTRDWSGLLEGDQEAFMRIGAALFEAGRSVGTEYDDLAWLLAASMEVSIGYVERDGCSQLRVAMDYDGQPGMVRNLPGRRPGTRQGLL